jgi:CheY-like chemotaxis protein
MVPIPRCPQMTRSLRIASGFVSPRCMSVYMRFAVDARHFQSGIAALSDLSHLAFRWYYRRRRTGLSPASHMDHDTLHGAPPMAEVSPQIPNRPSVPLTLERKYDRGEPVPDCDSVKSRSLSVLPTRTDGEASLPVHPAVHPDPARQIRLVLVDDHLAFRQPLAFMLMREPDITVVGQAATIEEAHPLLPQADIVLIDLELPDGDGVTLLQELRMVNPQATAFVLTGASTTEARARAVAAGAAGVMHKTCSVSEVVAAIRCLHAGKPLL